MVDQIERKIVAFLLVSALGSTAAAQDSHSVAPDTLRGRSGQLLARMVGGARDGTIRIVRDLFGDEAASTPGIYANPGVHATFSFINMLPFAAKNAGRIGSYRVGSWPAERRGVGSLPEGFIEITPENQETRVSEHFRLRDFLTHDQQHVWPKYLVLREALVDKLELVIADLKARGYRVNRMVVMSGFRTPQYNRGGRGGRATDSRHQYGDAADVLVDNNGDGSMDDLNGDGKVNAADARVILQSVDRVEKTHPELLGGAGVYRATRAHGPFLHVDVRGARVRWG
ncbi:MAG: D-Ala-D-Ala carboxypeptidase family metallohydrolase [Gemmatimonadota bacterium]